MTTLMRNGLPRQPIGVPDGKYGVWFNDMAGGSHPSSLLTGPQARWIVRCAKAGVETASLAAMLGVSQSTVRAVTRGVRYAKDTEQERRLCQNKLNAPSEFNELRDANAART